MSRILSIAITALTLIITTSAWAWGERGHHIVGRTGAKLVETVADKEAKSKGVVQFFQQRAFEMGHLSNIPDTSWKESSRHKKSVLSTNTPTHYVDMEILAGTPGRDPVAYVKKIKALPRKYSDVLKLYQDKPNPLPGTPKKYKKINVYNDVGTNPWRVGELYEALVAAFQCAKNKEGKSDLKKERKKWSLPLAGAPRSKPSGFYKCNKGQSRLQSLSAAVALAGVMGHFIGDVAQPYHVTINFDGWETGNGGVHHYMEGDVVNFLPPTLEADVLTKMKNKTFKGTLEMDLQVNWSEENAATGFALNLAGNSFRRLPEAIRLDDEFAVTKKGTKVPSGDKSFLWGKKEDYKKAIRRLAQDKKVLEGHKDFIVERLSVGSFALARIWLQAWKAGGSPDLKDVEANSIPYALDVPFLWPTYDLVATKKLRNRKM